MLELKGENPFKSIAYTNAARALEQAEGDVLEMIRNGDISKLKGVGDAISKKLQTLVTEGRLPYYEDLKEQFPPGLLDMLEIPGMGPKKVKMLFEDMHIDTIEKLEKAAKEDKLSELEGFGKKTQQKILQGIEQYRKYSARFRLSVALDEAQKILPYLKKNKKIKRIEVAGSLRRYKESAKDIDIVASCSPDDREQVMDYFCDFEDKKRIIGHGETKSSILLFSGMGCDLRLVDDDEFPYALHHFTGSREHNTAMRGRAKKMNLTMNEYGLFKKDDSRLDCKDESEIFAALKLSYIPPELREDMGEIDAAENDSLPELVTEADIQGILHAHSTWSDGAESIKTMAEEVRSRGYSYLGISDHSKSVIYANGLNEDRVKRQQEEIDKLNEEMHGFRIFKGIEVDILQKGKLDYDDKTLESFDFVIAAVHQPYNLSEKEQTERICEALRHPAVSMLAHPTGRLILSREGYAVDMAKVLECAAKEGKAVEINAHPKRLDLDWRWGRLARDLGLMTSVNPDAHKIEHLEYVKLGVGIARKGWFGADKVLNTRKSAELEKWFKNAHSGKKS